MSQIRMQNHFGAVKSEERYYIDADLLQEIKQVSIALECTSKEDEFTTSHQSIIQTKAR